MKLKQSIVDQILSTSSLSLAIAARLGFTQTWIRELARSNKKNGPLTTSAAIQVIREDLNLTDADILEEMETEPQS